MRILPLKPLDVSPRDHAEDAFGIRTEMKLLQIRVAERNIIDIDQYAAVDFIER